MKKLCTLLAFLPLLVLANEKEVPSKVTSATVYLSGAQVTREATIHLNSGMTEMKFTDLSPLIDRNSIQFSGLKSSSILSFNYNVSYITPKEDTVEANKLADIIIGKNKEKAILENLIKGLVEEETIITSNRKLWNEQESLSLEKVKQFSTYYRDRITKIKDDIYEHQLKINELELQIKDYKKGLNAIQSKNKDRKGEILLKLTSDLAQQINLTITYQVSNAGWFPVYDLKAESTKTNLNIHYKAHVYQETGEDWNMVNITLSTADPSINPQKPEVQTHFLNFVNPYNYKSATAIKSYDKKYNPLIKRVVGTVMDVSGALPGANIIIKGSNKGTQTDFDGKFSLDIEQGQELVISYIGFKTVEVPIYASVMNIVMEEDAQALDEVVVTGYGSTLQGRAAGIQIRDSSSIPEAETPLFIIDGIPVSEDDFKSLNEYEIANITMLKNDEATALYGSRASNGAVIVTTKEVISEQQMLNKEFKIKKEYTINSILDVTVIGIEKYNLPVAYQYFAAPVLNENVFLTATLNDWEKLGLLPGEANIYFAGTFAGKTYINPFQVEKKLMVSLGTDQNITVKRKQLKSFKDKSFIGANRIVDKSYTIQIKNNKNEAVTILLMDRIPISQNKEIKVEDVQHNAEKYDEEKGLISWDLNLTPGETVEKKLAYQIKFPKGKRINL